MSMLRTDIIDNKIMARKIPDGFYELEATKKVNGDFHKKYWVLVEFTLFHLPERFEYTVLLAGVEVARYQMENKEMLHRFFKFMLGVESIKFNKMKQEKFEEFYQRCIDICCRLLGTQPRNVLEELINFAK